MNEGLLGCMTTPRQRMRIPEGCFYGADNGKFGKGYPGAVKWFDWLAREVGQYGRERCAWATAPDFLHKMPDGTVIGDAVKTLDESLPHLPRIRQLGVPAAFVAQDGCSAPGLIPFGEFDVLFLGGSDTFKLGEEGRWVTAVAVSLGVPVHMGRVNSRIRLKLAASWECVSGDGTVLSRDPPRLPKVLRWLAEINGTDPSVADRFVHPPR